MNQQLATQSDPHALFVFSGEAAFARHPRGGGLVALTARVADCVFVGPDARVENEAQVLGEYHIVDTAIVGGHSRLMGHGRVQNSARVDGHAVLLGWVRLSHSVHITGHAVLDGKLEIEHSTVIEGECHISGNMLISG